MFLLALDVVAVFTSLLGLFVIAAHRYPRRCVGTQDRPELPGPPGLPVIGNMIQLFQQRARMIGYLGDLERQYGPVFTFTMPFWGRNIVIQRPEWLDHVRRRRILFSFSEIVHLSFK